MPVDALTNSLSRASLGGVSARRPSDGIIATVGAPLPSRNYLLRALAPADRTALEPGLGLSELASGEALYEPEYPVDWVWFPLTAVLSVVTVMHDGRTVESDTVGRESAVGILAAISSAVCTSRTFAQVPGHALRLSAARLRHQAEHSAGLRKLLMRHALANVAQAHQSVACNALHHVRARVCRWLLMTQDRTDSDIVRLTQQHLATMVGVQRTTVTELLRELADQGVVATHRGHIDILDRAGLEARVCECYGTIQNNFERLIGQAPVTAQT
jgi:CRP-like cAMP-binding protein